jgi:hypothetical protein
MKLRMARVAGAMVASLAMVAGCTSSTKVVSSWKEPTQTPEMVKKVLVVGVSRETSRRRQFEDRFVASLKSAKLDAVHSYEVFPDPDLSKVDREAATRKLVEEGFTHVLLSRLVDITLKETYVPPTVVTSGYGAGWPGYYGGWHPYMSTTYVASPGYVRTEDVYAAETILYSLKDGKMVWTGLTETTTDAGSTKVIDGFVDRLLYEMRSKKVL